MSSLSQFANRIGTSITVLSHGKIAFNKYMASAIKNGIDVRNPDACLVINIGLNRTDFVLISKGRVMTLRATSISCGTFFDDIIFHMARMHNTRIDEPIAKQIWAAVGSAKSGLEEEPEPFEVVAQNRVTGLPMHIPVSHQEISHCLHRDTMSIILTAERVLETIPASIVEPLFRRGIYLTGEGAGVSDLAHRFEEYLRIPCQIISKNLDCQK